MALETDQNNKKGYIRREGEKLLNAEQIKQNNDYIKSAFDQVSSIQKSSRQESFEMACDRMVLTKNDLLKKYNQLRVEFLVSGSALFIALLFFGFWLASGNIFGILSAVGAFCFLFSLTINKSFRAYQIRIGELCSFKDFFQKKEEWYPEKLEKLRYRGDLKYILRENRKIKGSEKDDELGFFLRIKSGENILFLIRETFVNYFKNLTPFKIILWIGALIALVFYFIFA